MAVIKAPNKQYTGMSAGVSFCNGVGNTDIPHVVEWFKQHGYEVAEEEKTVTDKPPKDESPEDVEEVEIEITETVAKKPRKQG